MELTATVTSPRILGIAIFSPRDTRTLWGEGPDEKDCGTKLGTTMGDARDSHWETRGYPWQTQGKPMEPMGILGDPAIFGTPG